ncbi:hypothetical protein [Carboxylicivirga marina]|uniref:Outer membrane protein beta-barrel domain-containing protein n=1 Tax=Carboxylicivirga marina TaxID=2800988 RepID=A0ABS1HE47_9BACT|nr:hypothetical protein [Carboxylicivirga marina]MBK3515881.1 hypothetical protein [Carboxylicivirga marina]
MKLGNKFWNVLSYEGLVSLESLYGFKYQNYQFENVKTSQSFITGALGYKSKNYILHPNLIKLNIDLYYDLKTGESDYIQFPDQSEVRDLKKVYINASIFDTRPVSLLMYTNRSRVVHNREDLTDIYLNNKINGAILRVRNSFAPFSFTAEKSVNIQEEIQSKRTYNYENILYQIKSSTNISDRNNSYIDVSYKSKTQTSNIFGKIYNNIFDANFRNQLAFDADRKYTLNTFIRDFSHEQNGIQSSNFLIQENAFLKLPYSFTLNTNYNFRNSTTAGNKISSNQIIGRLSHQLFLSLGSQVFMDYLKSTQPAMCQNVFAVGGKIDYQKNIPFGKLFLGGGLSQRNVSTDSKGLSRNVYDEQHEISDGTITMLNEPFVDVNSIIVTDITNTVFYEPNLDYIIHERGDYIEIQRVPGGLMANNSLIYVDYSSIQLGSNSYTLNTGLFSAQLFLFNSFLNLYYKSSINEYNDIYNVNPATLNYLTQNIYGVRVKTGIINAGVEYEEHLSRLFPYYMTRYFFNLNSRYKKIIFSGNCSYQLADYFDANEYRNFYSFSSSVSYRINQYSGLNFNAFYNKQDGSNIYIEMLRLKCEYDLNIRRLKGKLSIEYYDQIYYETKLNLFRLSLKLIRRF